MRKEPITEVNFDNVLKKKERIMQTFIEFVDKTAKYFSEVGEDLDSTDISEESFEFYNFLKWILKEERSIKDYGIIKKEFNEINRDGVMDKHFGYFRQVMERVEYLCALEDETVKMLQASLKKDKLNTVEDYKPTENCVNPNSYGIICLKCGVCGRKF